MYLVARETEDRDSHDLAVTVAFGFSGRIDEFVDWLGFGIVPDDSEDEEEE